MIKIKLVLVIAHHVIIEFLKALKALSFFVCLFFVKFNLFFKFFSFTHDRVHSFLKLKNVRILLKMDPIAFLKFNQSIFYEVQ